MAVKQAETGHIDELRSLQRKNNTRIFSEQLWDGIIKREICLVYIFKRRIIGFIVIGIMIPDADDDMGRRVSVHGKYTFIFDILVDADHRRNGIGRTLLYRGCAELYPISGDLNMLIHVENNQPQERFYEKLGFKRVGTLEGYYRDSTPTEHLENADYASSDASLYVLDSEMIVRCGIAYHRMMYRLPRMIPYCRRLYESWLRKRVSYGLRYFYDDSRLIEYFAELYLSKITDNDPPAFPDLD